MSHEQERAAHKSAAAATASSSKSLLLYLYLIDLASSKVLFSGLELDPSPKTSHHDKGVMDKRAMIQGLSQKPRATLVSYEVTPGIKV